MSSEDNVKNVTLIPAYPGFYVLEAWRDGTGFSRDPVIAWQMAVGDYPFPVTIDGVHDIHSDSGIENPDGHIAIPGDRYFDSVEKWFEYAKDRLVEKNARATRPKP